MRMVMVSVLSLSSFHILIILIECCKYNNVTQKQKLESQSILAVDCKQ